ncbi:MAG TPA: hypothetical protein VK548_26300 [Candidatus Acidoferrum sp.]|nr:hypothetical protein [Candidatus Acidoferrum sp.]
MGKTPLGIGILTAIHNRVNTVVDDFANASVKSPGLLLRLLQDDSVELPDLQKGDVSGLFDVSKLLDGLELDDLLDRIGDKVRTRLEGLRDIDLSRINLSDLKLGDLQGFVGQLANVDALEAIRKRIGELTGGAGGSRVPDALRAIVGRQVGIGVSFISSLRNLADPDLGQEVLGGWRRYFFANDGFSTIDGIQIVPPGHTGLLKGLASVTGDAAKGLDVQALAKLNIDELQQGWKGLRGLLSERSAEQYVRDLIRILVEVGGNRRYRLPDRLPALLDKLPKQTQKTKAESWLKGAASMAESLVTSAVEEVALGVAQFQTNPILAAAAATYAGTAARKASQHVFLAEADVPIQQD